MSNYRDQRFYENQNRAVFPGVGRYEIPEILPETGLGPYEHADV